MTTSYTKVTLSGVHPESLIGLPFLVQQPGVGWAAVTESGIEDYAGMYLEHQNGQIMRARLSPRLDGSIWSVLVDTPMVTPWRVILINDHPEKFAESSLIPELNAPTQLKDTSWIRPGKILAASTGDVDSKIDFAGASGVDYVLVDDVTPELIARATAKKVGVWIHRDWRAVEGDMAASFPAIRKNWVVPRNKGRRHASRRSGRHRLLSQSRRAGCPASFDARVRRRLSKPDGLEQTFPMF
ncbi:MAG: glycoside hydrolase family 97 N-terminal domain-containing protein [Acidobacteriota bacterium]